MTTQTPIKRSAEEVKARCKPILDKPKLIHLTQQSGSPTAAYIIVLAETENEELAKAGRWLAVLRRDYQEEFGKLIFLTKSCQTTEVRQEREELL